MLLDLVLRCTIADSKWNWYKKHSNSKIFWNIWFNFSEIMSDSSAGLEWNYLRTLVLGVTGKVVHWTAAEQRKPILSHIGSDFYGSQISGAPWGELLVSFADCGETSHEALQDSTV